MPWNGQDVVAKGAQSAALLLEHTVRCLGAVGAPMGGGVDVMKQLAEEERWLIKSCVHPHSVYAIGVHAIQ